MSAGNAKRRGVVLVDHGSRAPAANAHLDKVAEAIASERPQLIVETAHMESAAPDLSTAIASAIARGATEITVLPYFLGPGRHTTEDIPTQTEAARAHHPDVPIHLASPLGHQPAMTEAILTRYDEAQATRPESE